MEVNNHTDINKKNNYRYLSPQITEHKIDHDLIMLVWIPATGLQTVAELHQ